MSVRSLFSAVAIIGAAALAVPAIAADSLERSVGVRPGLFTQGQLAHIAVFGVDSPAEVRSILDNPQGPLAMLTPAQPRFATRDVAKAKPTLRLASVSIKAAPGKY